MKQLNRDEIEGLEFNRCFVEDCHIFSDKEYDLFKPRSGNFYIYVDTNSQKECFELEASEVEDWKKLVENQIDVKIKGEGVMKKMENNMFGISLDDTPIYRVVTVERLLEMFRDRKIVLVKPRKWDDPYENFLLNAKGMTPNGEEVDFEQTRERFYGSCWTTTEESDAMWRIYAPDKNGVKIKTTAKKLFREFWEANANISRGLSCFIGKVKYFDEAEIENILRGKEQVKEFFDNLTESSRNQLKTLLIKREEFSHEEEVRLIFRNSNPRKRESGKREFVWDMESDIYHFKIDPLNLFDEIVFDPRMGKALYECFKNELLRLKFDKNKIRQSSLYNLPDFVIELNWRAEDI